MLYYFFCQEIPIYLAERMYPDISHSTYVKWYGKWRSCVVKRLRDNDCMFDGEVDTTLQNVEEYEIDESHFGKKRKYNRGALRKNVWVFGLMKRDSRKTFFRIVQKRDSETLLPLIKQHVASGSTIYSDDWKAYSCLSKQGYVHKVVVHKETFVSKEGACTNGIEGWFINYSCNSFVGVGVVILPIQSRSH
jgi:transposase